MNALAPIPTPRTARARAGGMAMTLTALALVTAALTACDSGTTAPDAAPTSAAPVVNSTSVAATPSSTVDKPASVLGPDGLGALKLGMSKDQALATGMIDEFRTMDGQADSACPVSAGLTGQGGTVWWSTRLGVASIAPSAGVRTVDGIEVGASRQKVAQTYPGWTLAAGEDGHGLVPVPGNPAAVYRIEIKDDKVSSVGLQYAKQDCYE